MKKLDNTNCEEIPREILEHYIFAIHPKKFKHPILKAKNYQRWAFSTIREEFSYEFSKWEDPRYPEYEVFYQDGGKSKGSIFGVYQGRVILHFAEIFAVSDVILDPASIEVVTVLKLISEQPRLQRLVYDREARKVEELFPQNCELCQSKLDERLDIVLCDDPRVCEQLGICQDLDHTIICEECYRRSNCLFCKMRTCLICNLGHDQHWEDIPHLCRDSQNRIKEGCLCQYQYCLGCTTLCSSCERIILQKHPNSDGICSFCPRDNE